MRENELNVGDHLGGYEIRGLLGRGGMGSVYDAWDAKLERRVALKVAHAELTKHRQFRDAFLDEARAMAELDDPRIVPVYAFGHEDGRSFLVMKLVGGPSLERYILEHQPVPPVRAAQIVHDMAAGLDVLHRAGRVHGDVKPANVLLDENGRASLTDLGLSHRLGAIDAEIVRGTPGYMAPERIRGDALPAEAQRSQDVYALTVVAHQMLTGARPFRGSSREEILRQHLESSPPAPSRTIPTLPMELDRVVLRGMAKLPKDRWPDALSFAEAFTLAATPRRLIWVVDDDADHAELLGLMLERALPVRTVRWTDPVAALRAAQDQLPDVILVDLDMPQLDGKELTAALRNRADRARLPVIAVTGRGSAQDWAHLRELGADACLLKPVVKEQLIEEVSRHLDSRVAAAEAEAQVKAAV
ncbi:MAG: serine/threonine-protein kinase [Sandaracinaceae bacterium]